MNWLTLSRCFVLLVAVSPTSLAAAEQSSDLRKRLKDPAPAARMQAALTLAEANDAEAVPVLIDLLAELPAEERRAVEQTLTKLAGEWTPASRLEGDDKIARQIHRDAWRAWWRNSDGPALLSLLHEHTLTPQLRRKIKEHIHKLGDDQFSIREAAAKELFALGRVTLPQLREAIASRDPEIVLRSRILIDRIEQDPSRRLPSAAVRLLALRKPPGAAEALLAFLPLSEEENLTDDVQKSLVLLARRDGKLEPALVRALKETDETLVPPAVRAVIAEALVQGGGKDGCDAVRPLLKDKDRSVRLRVALSLILTGERGAVAVLIDLMPVVSDEQIGQIEDVLTQLAGTSAPETPWGTEQADKQKCRDAWAAWWKSNSDRVDLAHLIARPWYGYTLLCDSSRNRVYEIDRHGKERWAIEGVPFPVDAWVVGGDHVLIAEYMGRRISERDFHGSIIWSRAVPAQPVNVQRLANGHTFIATLTQIQELDRAGQVVYTIHNVGGQITAAYRARDGRIVCVARNGSHCLIMDTTGKVLKQFPSNRDGTWTSGLDLLTNGHILITQPNRQRVAEYDRNGKRILEVDAPLATTATALPDGHFLVASSAAHRAYEVDRNGKVVWEHKSGGNIFRARRR